MKGAVLTGDIIHSTKLTPELRASLIEVIDEYLTDLQKLYGIKYEIYRGDSFQCMVKKPGDALKIALLIKTYIRSQNPSELYDIKKKGSTTKLNRIYTTWIFDARIAIAIGDIGSGRGRLATSDALAFFHSGHLLDEIKATKQHLAMTSDDKYRQAWETESILLDAIIRKTTALQCEVIHYKLGADTEIEIANKLNIGQSAVNQRSTSADWHAIDHMVYRFEQAYKND